MNKYFRIINNKIYGANTSAQGFYFTIDSVTPDGTSFIFKVDSGSSGRFLIGTNSSLTYDYNLTTSDGQTILNQTGDYDIIFPSTNTDYIVEITGTFPHMVNGPLNPDSYKILDVLQWGNQPWVSMNVMFAYCTQLTSFSATDIPDLSNVTNMGQMFYYTSFNQDIGNWDVSSVTNMGGMFYSSPFNQNIGNWDVSNVTNMTSMFRSSPFNQNIGNWDVSSVTNMDTMFYSNTSFNQDISNWDVSNVINMSGMFRSANSFNQNIGNWDVSSAFSMGGMFRSNTSFNQDISNWNVSNVNNMDYMFSNATPFNQDLSSWCVQIIPSKPTEFDYGATSWTLPKPAWGTCPP